MSKPPKHVRSHVTLDQARYRLKTFGRVVGRGPWPASLLAEIIWPDTVFPTNQKAGAAASRILKAVGCQFADQSGWIIPKTI